MDEQIYIRNNSESIKASAERVNKMLVNRNLDTFDRTESLLQKLTFNYVRQQFKLKNQAFRPKALGFYTPDKTFTNTAFLMSEQNDNVVKVAVFDGLTVANFKDRKEFTGAIPKQINDTLEYLNLVNPIATRITGKGQRDEQSAYPVSAIREAVVNALSHRSYFSRSPVQIEVYDNRLTIMSSGPLPGGLQASAVLNGQTLPRNRNVVNILFKLGFIENYGTGLRRILDSYESFDKQPELLAQEDFVKVTLPNLQYDRDDMIVKSVQVVVDQNDSKTIISDEQAKIIAHVQTHQTITRAEVETLLQVKRSQATRYLKKLMGGHILKKVGAGPATRYILVSDN